MPLSDPQSILGDTRHVTILDVQATRTFTGIFTSLLLGGGGGPADGHTLGRHGVNAALPRTTR
eukprot:SAG11_NODE_544_length_8629_cov_3.550229_4_plen_63_part_00